MVMLWLWMEPWFGPGPEDDETLRLLDGQHPQQDLIHQGEYRGVGADAQGQGEHHHEREPRVLGQRAEGIAQVLHEVVHRASSPIVVLSNGRYSEPRASRLNSTSPSVTDH